MELKINKSGTTGVLTIAEELNVQNAEELKTNLLQAIKTLQSLVVDLSDVPDIDLSCLQLLCSANRTMKSLNKTLTLEGKDMHTFHQIMETSGFARIDECKISPDSGCFKISSNE